MAVHHVLLALAVAIQTAPACAFTKLQLRVHQEPDRAPVETQTTHEQELATQNAGETVQTSTNTLLPLKVKTCYELAGPLQGNCWETRPRTDKKCTSSSGTKACFCDETHGTGCNINELNHTNPRTGRCLEISEYVRVSGKTERWCLNMKRNTHWKHKMVMATKSDGPPRLYHNHSWTCWHPYVWRDGKCLRMKRFLGEDCWDGYMSKTGGKCAKGNDWKLQAEYNIVCYKHKCTPLAFAQNKQECNCADVGWKLLAACSASNGTCDGHACMHNFFDGKKYCDYTTPQDW